MDSRQIQGIMNASRPAAVAYVPALIGALLSVFCIRIGFLGFLFLLPLGVVAYAYQGRAPWFCLFLTILGNGILSSWTGLLAGSSFQAVGGDILYVSVMTAVFTWVIVPPAGGPGFLRVRGAYRIAAASLLGALSLTPIMRSFSEDGGFQTFLQAQAELIASMYTSSSPAGQNITPEAVARLLGAMTARGGAAVSCFILFVLSRQCALLISRFIQRERFDRWRAGGLVHFHVPHRLIWLLSGSLLGVLLGVKLGILPLEITACNILVICAMLYLAQGMAVLLSLLYRLPLPPLLKFVLNVLLFMLMVSPGINAVLLGILAILGIAENWASFRAPETNRPPSTPGA
ncbi:MAG: DUF2232 domain-containing protein [Treponema sp.]|jgi:hypothetical protein|nr:DUF2232 domain-containing protein [Treponema sp.]